MEAIVKNRIWIEKDGHLFLGPGRVELLMKIDEFGSMLAAAKAMNMSYKKAWLMMQEMQLVSARPILIKNTGGKNGGGTQLTEYGRSLAKKYDEINRQCKAFLQEAFTKIEL